MWHTKNIKILKKKCNLQKKREIWPPTVGTLTPNFHAWFTSNLPRKCDLDFNNHSWERFFFVLFDKSNCVDVCKFEVTTYSSNFKHWRFCNVAYYNRNVNIGLEGEQFNLELKLDWFFEQTFAQIISKWQMLSSFKRGAIYLLKSSHKFWYHYYFDFLRSFTI